MAEENKPISPADLQAALTEELRFIYILRKHLHLPWFLVTRAHHFMYNKILGEGAIKSRYQKALEELGLAEPKPKPKAKRKKS